MTRAYVGLGSNLGDSPGILREALARMRELGTEFSNSDLYLTDPWGKTDQPKFYNAVAAFDTDATSPQVLDRLLEIEKEFGRTRDVKWGPRLLDLDLLLHGQSISEDPNCRVPHPHLRDRAFALAPLAELSPEVRLPPDGLTARAALDGLGVDALASVSRLRGTAVLVPPPRLDYDAPGGAGAHFDALRPFSHLNELLLETVIDATGPLAGRRVLDVGCGTGRFSEKMAEAGALVTGFDSSKTMLAAALSRRQNALGNPQYIRGDANVALPAGPYDAVTAFHCIQYFDAEAWCRRVFQSLAPGGTTAIATFAHSHFAETQFARFFPSLPAIDMARFPSIPALKKALAGAGFGDVEVREIVVESRDEPAALIARVEAKYLSSFYLIPEEEFRNGIEAMREAWLGRDKIERIDRSIVVSGRRPANSG
jgi:2-amino-4-hydroxy-6-hydroxymethyldihydropteridine diphosphokinase